MKAIPTNDFSMLLRLEAQVHTGSGDYFEGDDVFGRIKIFRFIIKFTLLFDHNSRVEFSIIFCMV